jgi:hypothetical protein
VLSVCAIWFKISNNSKEIVVENLKTQLLRNQQLICKHLHCVYSLPWLDVVHIWLGYAVFYDDTGAFAAPAIARRREGGAPAAAASNAATAASAARPSCSFRVLLVFSHMHAPACCAGD